MDLLRKIFFGSLLAGLFFLLLSKPPQVFAASSQNNTIEKTRVACVGNSVTRGYGLSFPEKDSYPSQLQLLLGENFFVGNFGHSGATLLSKGHRPFVQTQDYRAALDFEADIVVIHLGLNDTDPRNWPNYRDEFISDYLHLIDSFRKGKETETQVFICRMTPIFHGHSRFKSGTRDWFWQIQEAIEIVAAASNARLIDLHSPLYSRPDLFKDNLHPDEEGAGIIARTVYQNITGDFGGLSLSPLFGNHMVLQQNIPHVFRGKANANDTIVATFVGESKSGVASLTGDWSISFDPVPAGGPYTLEVSARDNQSMRLTDVLVGEVWLCAGQSNMEFPLKNASEASFFISEAETGNLRLLNLKGLARPDDTAWDLDALERINRLDYFEGEWSVSNREQVSDFSAIAYSFGKMLSETLKVPVGLIQVTVGGAPLEAFIDRKTLEFNPALIDVLYHWKQNDFYMEWVRQRALRNLSMSKDAFQRHPFEPAYVFEATLERFRGMPLAGVIFYQGESNAHNPEHYQRAFTALVDSWRAAFNQPEMPFYFAQLSSHNRPSWPQFREVQRQLAQQIPNALMVVTSDLGDSLDVHPTRKTQVGERFARLALYKHYQHDGFSDAGPRVSAASFDGNSLVITFSYAKKLLTSDQLPVRELEIAGPDRVFQPVSAKINGNQIVVDLLHGPVSFVRYGWRAFSRGNLVNENGWPVSAFQVEAENLHEP